MNTPKFQRREERKLGLLMSEAEKREQIEAWAKDDLEKLIQLRDYFDISYDPGWELRLALELAIEQRTKTKYLEPSKRGRPIKWTELSKAVLIVEHERIKKLEALNDEEADAYLIRRSPWLEVTKQNEEHSGAETYRKEEGQSLRQQRDAVDQRLVAVIRKSFLWHEHEGELQEWDEYVKDVVKNPLP